MVDVKINSSSDAVDQSALLLETSSEKSKKDPILDHNVDFSQSSSNRYNHSLKTLIPFRPFSKSQAHPNDRAGLFSFISLSWLSGLVWKTFKKSPTIDDLWSVSEYDETRSNYKRLSKIWENEVKENGITEASLHRVVWKFVRTRVILSTFCFIVGGAAMFLTSSIIIRQLLHYVSSENVDSSVGLVLILSMICSEFTRACMFCTFFLINYRTAIRSRAAVLLLIFKKVMKMSSTNKKNTIGELVTLCSNDGDRIFEVVRAGNGVVLGPLLFVIGTAYTWHLLGPVSLVGSAVFVLVLPFQGILVKVMNTIRVKAIKFSEARIMKINEIISSMKMVKMYSWELFFTKMINAIREKELTALKKSALLQSINVSIAFLTPVFASVLMISAFVLLNNPLTPELAFTAIAIYNAMANSLKLMPLSVKSLADSNVSLNRFKHILALDSLHEYVTDHTSVKGNAIEVENASFAWNSSIEIESIEKQSEHTTKLIHSNENLPKAVLNNVSFIAPQGSLIGVFGTVGSGKTSVIASILGQMSLLKGSVAVSGTAAYCAQQAWLMNSTIRDNILFGSVYDKKKYEDVVMACELLKDFEVLQSGDLTEVGERGINLSGGQKQRISLARSLYGNKDIYLLDDPLSALDAHVGKAIFTEVIMKRLKNAGKTVLLVTHQTQYLSYCDSVLQVENGVVTQHDSLNKVVDNSFDGNAGKSSDDELCTSNGDFETADISASNLSKADVSKSEIDLIKQGKLMTVEESGNGVPLSTLLKYIKAGGGYVVSILLLLFFLINVGSQQFSTFWLSYWLRSTSTPNSTFLNSSVPVFAVEVSNSSLPNIMPTFNESVSNNILDSDNVHVYLVIYGLSALFMFVISVLRGYAFVSMTIQASRSLHSTLFQTVMHGTMEFFDTTPIGRILNRFQKDMDEQDVMLPYLLEMLLFNACSLFCAMGLVAYVFPKFLLVIGLLIPAFLLIYIVFRPSAREMRRLDVLTRSPWFAHITTAVSGLDTIRTYKRTSYFTDKFSDFLDQNSIPFYLFVCVNRWLAVRLDFLTVCTSVVIALLVVINKDIVPPASAGLALSSLFLISGVLQFTVRLLTETEARFVCVDRIKYYIDHTPQEHVNCAVKLDSSWPKNGKIEFQNVSMKYRKGLPLALKDLSFTLHSGEKVGIVGRTGSGKSSLAVCLFRLTELDQGNILIDGVDISTISLPDLRCRMSIIPQDPVMFSGTVRYNLDPLDQCSDADIWSVLEQVHLKNSISSLTGQLNGDVLEGGRNFSVGERQLLCLARALLRNTKILVLDEATAAIDHETEKIVHDVIESTFSNCTVFTIAHRLSTVTKSDRIMVLDEGMIVEFDKPEILLKDDTSAFHKMSKTFGSTAMQE